MSHNIIFLKADEGVQELETLRTEITFRISLRELEFVPSLKECFKEESYRIEVFRRKSVFLMFV